MSTPQEYWDVCLIKTWRNMGTFKDARKMFFSITNEWPDEINPPLLRYPKSFLYYTTQMRYFMATFLPKMNTWLWDQPPEKDIELLKKITKSKYTVSKKPHMTEDDKERANLAQVKRREKLINGFNTMKSASRNNATDWNVVKGSVKVRRSK